MRVQQGPQLWGLGPGDGDDNGTEFLDEEGGDGEPEASVRRTDVSVGGVERAGGEVCTLQRR